jgi:RNA-directed DNA polymerase
MNTKIISGTPINTKKSLIRTLGITASELDTFLNTPLSNRYKEPRVSAFKKDGSKRIILCPNQLTRKIQRRINNRIFKVVVKWPSFLYGSTPNEEIDGVIQHKDYVNCARVHCESKSILKVDISDFFNQISRYFVLDLFITCFGYDEEVSEILTDICCNGGFLVQGALTSSYVATLIFYDKEEQIVNVMNRQNLRYTRLIDDITVSSKVSLFDYYHVKQRIFTMLMDKDLPINHKKTAVFYSSMEPLTVHGLRVEFKEPRLPAKEVARLKSAVKNLEKLASEKKYRKSKSYRKDFHRCVGRVNKLARVKHNQHEKLITRIQKIKPYPSGIDIKLAYLIIDRLKVDFNKKNATYWYFKRFNQLIDRIQLIKNLYPIKAKKLKNEIINLKPAYEP